MRPAFPLLALFLLQSSLATAIDLLPGDVRAPAAGISNVQIAWQHSERGANYINGKKQPGDPQVVIDLALLRLGHAFTAGTLPAYVYTQIPVGEIRPKGDLAGREGDAGMGDTSFLFAIWPYANHEKQEYFALGSYLSVPTGSYTPEKRFFNMGENRYRTALQAGYQTLLVKDLTLMTALDVSWFGKNDEFGAANATLEQDPLYAFQMALRYELTPRYSVAAAYFYTEGGERRVNDMALNDETRQHRYQLTGTTNTSYGRLMLQYGGDLKTENGQIESQRVILRWSRVF